MLTKRFLAKDTYRSDLFKNQTVLITGGGSGIGRLIADSFAELGANLVIASRDIKKLEAVELEIKSEYNSEIRTIVCNIADPKNVKEMVKEAFRFKGNIDILINNAGANTLRPTEALTPVRWQAIIDTVLSGTFYVTRETALFWIKAKQKGNIINIASTTGVTGSPHMTPSGAAKAGMINMGRSLGSEWGKYGIRVNDVSPGPVFTKGSFERLWLNDEVIELINKKIPLGRFPAPEDIIGSVLFLASPAAEMITGSSINVDGGESLRQSFAELIAQFRPRRDSKDSTNQNLPKV